MNDLDNQTLDKKSWAWYDLLGQAIGKEMFPTSYTGVLRADSGVVTVDSALATITTFTTANVLSSGNVQTIAHGLGRIPISISISLLVTTTTGGWAVDDEIFRWIDGLTGIADSSVLVGSDTTNITVACNAANIAILNKTTAASVASAVGNFKLRVRVM